MSRVRWAVAMLAGGLGLLSGCSTLRDHPWFSRSRPAAAPPCCDATAAAVPVAEGPVLEGGPPFVPPPPGALPPGADLQPPGTNGTIRPVPQAQPIPAEPSRRTPGLFIDRWKQ
jgi:hypothetical protein